MFVWVCVCGPPGSLHQPPLTTSCLPSFTYSLLPLMELATSFLRWGNTHTHTLTETYRHKCVYCMCVRTSLLVMCVYVCIGDGLRRSTRRRTKIAAQPKTTLARRWVTKYSDYQSFTPSWYLPVKSFLRPVSLKKLHKKPSDKLLISVEGYTGRLSHSNVFIPQSHVDPLL